MPTEQRPIALLLTGHSHWGKSCTLRALTAGSLKRSWNFGGRDFFIRRMSNDDHTDDYNLLVSQLSPKLSPAVILAFCPDFSDLEKDSEECLKILARNYTVSFFVLKHSFGDERIISPDEIETLERYGKVEVFDRKKAEAEARAAAFEAFILAHS